MPRRPPVRSIVIKTKRPTPAQIAQQQAAARAAARAKPANLISSTNASIAKAQGPPANRQTGSRDPRIIPPQHTVPSPLAKPGLAVTGGRFPVARPKAKPAPKPTVTRVARPAPRAPVVSTRPAASPPATPPAHTTAGPAAPAGKVTAPKAPQPTGQPVTPGGGMAGLFGGLGPTAYIDQLYAPQEQALQQQQAARIAAFQQLTSAFAQSLAQQGASLQPFLNAGSQIAADAGNSAASMIAENPNTQTQADLQAIGAPASQQANVAAQNQQVFTGGAGVLKYVGGALPANQFAQDMAARASYLQALPVIGQAIAGRGLNQLSFQGQQAALQLAGEKAKALQQARVDLANYVQTNQKNKLAQQIAASELGLKTQNQQFNQRATATRLNQNAARIKQSQANSDRNYQLALTRLGLQRASLRLRALQAERKLNQGAFTPIQVSRFKATAHATAQEAVQGVHDKNGNLVHPQVSYQQALNDMVHAGIPASIAQYALNQYWLPNAAGSHTARVGGQLYVYFPWEQPAQGRPLGVPKLALGARRKRR